MAATLLDTREHLAPGYRPGERMVAGKPYVFNAGSLGLYLANEAVLTAPADLTRLSYDDVSALLMAAETVLTARPERTGYARALDVQAAEILAKRAANERASRPEYVKAFGGVA